MLVTTATLLFTTTGIAQTPLESAAQLENRALNTLASWGAANAVVGAAGVFLESEPEKQAFHTMNAGWGAVNLGLALAGKASSRRDFSTRQHQERWLRLPSIFAFNAGLDVAYISAGVWLWRSGAEEDDPTREGWGQSLVLQGSALMIFDLWMAQRFNQANRSIWLSGSLKGAAIQGQF